jgi:hypothetical protein
MNEKRERIDSSTPEPPNLIPKISNDEDLNQVELRHFPLSTKEDNNN